MDYLLERSLFPSRYNFTSVFQIILRVLSQGDEVWLVLDQAGTVQYVA